MDDLEKRNICDKLMVFKKIQDNNPSAHLGGSLGLFLHGKDLKRSLINSDLDITAETFDVSTIDKDFENRSDSNDFDFGYKINHNSVFYTKIDIRINPEPSFEIIMYFEMPLNVSRLKDILFWKTKYANKGVEKHKHDLIAMETGIRPAPSPCIFDDELPF